MVNPLVSRKEGIHCEGTFKRGSRTGQTCDALVLGKDDISVVCTNSKCGTPHELVRLLNEALEYEYLTPEQVLQAVPSLNSKKETPKMKVEKGTGYWAKKVQELAEAVFKDFLAGDAKNPDHVNRDIGISDSGYSSSVSIVTGIRVGDDSCFRFKGLVVLASNCNLSRLYSNDESHQKIFICVQDLHYMKDAKRFARRLQTLLKALNFPPEIVVEQNF